MAAITTAVVVGGTAAYSANRQASAAKDAAKKQAQGVENARQDSLSAADRARTALTGYAPMAQQQAQASGQSIDPRSEYLGGLNSGAALTNQGYGQAQSTLSPLAAYAQPYLEEQYNLLGMGGSQAQQQALSRVSDPLVAEQERALMRNSAALGGVGGNELAALADMTRSRTEANIGNRLSQLAGASTPGLSALQQIANLRLGRGQDLGNMFLGAGRDLSTMETNRRQALANLELGQGSELAQLSQNLGTARAGYDAYRANNAPWLAQGIQAGLGAYMGGGGGFGGITSMFGGGGGGGGYSQSPLAPIANQMPPYQSTQPGQVNVWAGY